MESQEFLTAMAEDILETDQEITMETELSDIDEWDSLALVSFLAMANVKGKSLNRDTIKSARTIGDLYNLVNTQGQK